MPNDSFPHTSSERTNDASFRALQKSNQRILANASLLRVHPHLIPANS